MSQELWLSAIGALAVLAMTFAGWLWRAIQHERDALQIDIDRAHAKVEDLEKNHAALALDMANRHAKIVEQTNARIAGSLEGLSGTMSSLSQEFAAMRGEFHAWKELMTERRTELRGGK